MARSRLLADCFELLRELEWRGAEQVMTADGDWSMCSVCPACERRQFISRGNEQNAQHEADCPLQAMIRRLKG